VTGYALLGAGVVFSVLIACASAPERTLTKPIDRISAPIGQHQRLLREGCTEAGICLVFALRDECPNWDAALAIAKRKAGCAGLGNDDPQGVACRKAFACDICQFLENPLWPPAYIKVLPGKKFIYLGLSHAEGSTDIADRPYTPGSIPAAWIELRKARCYGPGVGIWPFWEDNVEFLAKALIHESLHLCKAVGGYGPSVNDPTTKNFVEDCF